MGKSLIQQRRGKGSIFRSLRHQLKGDARHASISDVEDGIIKDFFTNKIHTAPLMKVTFGTEERIMIAPQGLRIGESIKHKTDEIKTGNTVSLKDIPEGTMVYNIENQFGDGGKFVRSSGNAARVSQRTNKGISVILPSKKVKVFHPECRATIGIVAGGGRPEKPFMKAGNKFKLFKAKHKQYPHVCGISMNSVNHPFGGKSSKIKGRPLHCGRNTPPGRKVGKIAPSRTGYKR